MTATETGTFMSFDHTTQETPTPQLKRIDKFTIAVQRERNELRAQVEQLRADLATCREELAL